MGNLKIISNSSPLINLSKTGQLALLEPLYGKILIPRAVYQELIEEGRGREGVAQIKQLLTKGILEVQDVQDVSLVRAFQKDLDFGESEVLVLALKIGADLIIVDEVDARRIAELHNIKKTGFVGVLIKAKHQGLLKKVKGVLDGEGLD